MSTSLHAARHVWLRSAMLCAALTHAGTSTANVTEQSGDAKLSVEAALHAALERSPSIEVERRRVLQQGWVAEAASTFPLNPTVNFGGGGRFDVQAGPGVDGVIGVSQRLPLFGRWGAFEDAEVAKYEASKVGFWSKSTAIAVEAARAYLDLQRLASLSKLVEQRVLLVDDLLSLAKKKMQAGEGSALDVTLWEAELGSLKGQQALVDGRLQGAATMLAMNCGLEPATVVAVDVLTPTTMANWLNEPSPRADVEELKAAIGAAEKAHAFEKAKAWPDLTISANLATEGASWRSGPAGEAIGGLGVSFPIPLFFRNQPERERAKGRVNVLKAERTRQQKLVQAEVDAAHTLLVSAKAAASSLETVTVRQQQNVELLTRAHRAGKLGVTDVLLRQKSVLDAKASYINSLHELATARLRLIVANGAFAKRVKTIQESAVGEKS